MAVMQKISESIKGKSDNPKVVSSQKSKRHINRGNSSVPQSDLISEPMSVLDNAANSLRKETGNDRQRRLWLQHMVLDLDGFSDPQGIKVRRHGVTPVYSNDSYITLAFLSLSHTQHTFTHFTFTHFRTHNTHTHAHNSRSIPMPQVRPVPGINGCDYLGLQPLVRPKSYVFGPLISCLRDVGYSNVNLTAATYDWRIPPGVCA